MKISDTLSIDNNKWFDLCSLHTEKNIVFHPFIALNKNYISAYILYHIKTGCFYFGSSMQTYGRLVIHRSSLLLEKHPNKKLQECYNDSKFIKVYTFQTINIDEANSIEKNLIKFNIDNEKMLNVIGRPLSLEMKEKLRSVNLGRVITPEHRFKISLSSKGKILSSETKNKLSKAHLGKKLSDETKNKIRNINLGKKYSDETKNKMRNSHIGFKHSIFSKNKMSLANKNRIYTQEQRDNIRSLKEKNVYSQASLEILSKRMMGNKYSLGYNHTDEAKEKISLKNKGKIKSLETKNKLRLSKIMKIKKLTINDIIYDGLCEASRKLNIPKSTIVNRINNLNFEKYFYN